MIVPFSVVIIKPLSVGRGDAPNILQAILDHCPVSLRLFRSWMICETTKQALHYNGTGPIFPPGPRGHSWVCLFTHIDRITDPTQLLDDYFGNLNPLMWTRDHLRHRFGGFTNFGANAHPSDDVVHLAHASRANFEANVLFLNFNESNL